MAKIQICKAIACPYFSESTKKSYGCQYYSVAVHCHLIGNPDDANYRAKLKGDNLTQYELRMDEGDYSIEELKEANEAFLKGDQKYQQDILIVDEMRNYGMDYPNRIL